MIYAIWKGWIDGYYPDERPMLYGSLIVGLGCLFLAGRMDAADKKARTEAKDREHGVG
jgi:hypothetical protein